MNSRGKLQRPQLNICVKNQIMITAAMTPERIRAPHQPSRKKSATAPAKPIRANQKLKIRAGRKARSIEWVAG